MASKVVCSIPSKLPVVTIFTLYADGGELVESWKKRLDKVPFNLMDHQSEEVITQLQEAEILLTDPGLIKNIFHQLPKTKWVQTTWAGIDHPEKVNSKDISPPFLYTRLGHGLGTNMAEYVIGEMIAHERHFYELKKSQEQKIWDWKNCRALEQLTLGIIGLGDIGQEVARLCKAFGMRIWGLGRRELSPEEISKNVDEYRPLSRLAELLANCDYVCSVLPQTPATDDLLSGDVLSSCTKQPVFINVGRGNVISEDAILNALDKGWISHAILDVFRTEPLPSSSPLWSSPKVTITPHYAANTQISTIIDVVEENYNRYINGKPLKYMIDWEQGY